MVTSMSMSLSLVNSLATFWHILENLSVAAFSCIHYVLAKHCHNMYNGYWSLELWNKVII